jgi:CheY-like chemotaxis protein
MTPIDVQLESTARDAVKMFEGEAKSAGVDLQFHIDDSCKRFGVVNVSLDPTRVLQILINLLTNAIKFTRLEAKRQILISLSISLERPTHNVDGRVTYIPRSGGSEAKTLQADWEQGQSIFVSFSVQDTGTGMSDAEHQLLFTRFSQTSPRTHIDYGGSGLGLFISRRLTEMHGGAIGFTSKKGVGSTFSFYVQSRRSGPTSSRRGSTKESSATVDQGLRAQKTVLRSKSYNEDAPLQSDANTPERTIPDSDLHILIVEDNLVNQRVLAKQLRNIGMHVAVANHGGEALEYLQTTSYCKADGSGNELTLILMDWEMPVMNGLECVAEIRKLQGQGVVNGHVPVIAVTANVRSEQVETALQAGMDDVISKPFRIPELRACIQKTLRNVAPVGPQEMQ